MPASKPQKRSGSRQPLGLVSANISFLPSNKKKRSSAAKAGDDDAAGGARGGGGDDDGSVSSTVSSRFSYRGIKNNLISAKKKRRGLLSSMVVAAGGRKTGGRAGGSSSSAAASDALGGGDADPPFRGDAFAYEDFDNFVGGRCVVGPTHTIDEMRSREEDGESPARHPKSNRPATLEVVDTEGRAARNPHVVCDLPASVTSPSWSEYGSAMMETWGVLERAANFIIDPPNREHGVPGEETGEGCAGCALVVVESDDPPRAAARADPGRGGAPTSVGAAGDGPVGVAIARRHREADGDRSRPCSSPLPGDLADDDAELGSVPTTPSDDDYFAPKEDVVSCAVPPHYSGMTASSSSPASSDESTRAGALLSVEIGRDWELEGAVLPRGNGKLGPAPPDDRGGRYVDIDDLESGNTTTTGYVAMADDDDVLAGPDVAIRRCFEPSAGDAVISPRSPAAMAMAFGSLVFLTHLIWVVSTKH